MIPTIITIIARRFNTSALCGSQICQLLAHAFSMNLPKELKAQDARRIRTQQRIGGGEFR